MQRCNDDSAYFSGATSASLVVQDLNPNAFRLNMIVVMIRALQCDISHLLGGIHIQNLYSEGLLTSGASVRLQHLAKRTDLLQIWQTCPVSANCFPDRQRRRWVTEQVPGVDTLQPIELLLDATLNIHQISGTCLKYAGRGRSPIICLASMRRVGNSIAEVPDDRQRFVEVAAVPKMVAQRRAPKRLGDFSAERYHRLAGGSAGLRGRNTTVRSRNLGAVELVACQLNVAAPVE